MTGFPTCGKISIFIRVIAIRNPTAIAMRATMTVSGRLSAASTRRMLIGPLLTAGLVEERLQITTDELNAQKSSPNIKTGDSIVYLRLNKKPLRLGEVINCRQTVLYLAVAWSSAI